MAGDCARAPDIKPLESSFSHSCSGQSASRSGAFCKPRGAALAAAAPAYPRRLSEQILPAARVESAAHALLVIHRCGFRESTESALGWW